MDRNLAVAVSRCGTISLSDVFMRHESLRARQLTGSASGGRWGPPGSFPVLYLGRPEQSIVVEAYRHLVDPTDGMTGDLVAPRRLVSCTLTVSDIVDLRVPENLHEVGLMLSDLTGPHEGCQLVGLAAHQLGLHGIIAPAATGLGETLALFEDHLSEAELPVVVQEVRWEHLPPDPRKLRLLEGHGE